MGTSGMCGVVNNPARAHHQVSGFDSIRWYLYFEWVVINKQKFNQAKLTISVGGVGGVLLNLILIVIQYIHITTNLLTIYMSKINILFKGCTYPQNINPSLPIKYYLFIIYVERIENCVLSIYYQHCLHTILVKEKLIRLR